MKTSLDMPLTSEDNDFKVSSLGLIPKDWNVIQLGKLGVFSKGKGILKDQVLEEGDPCILYGEIYTTHNFIVKEFKSFISEEVAKESKEIKRGDILFAGSGETLEEIGKAVAYTLPKKAFAGGDVIILSTNGKFNNEWLAYALETDLVRRQKRKLGQGHSVVHIYSSSLEKLNILTPTPVETNAIANLLSSWDKAIQTTEQLIAQKELRKKWLMQQLLTEKKRLKGFNKKWKEYKLSEIFDRVTRKNTESNTTVVTISAQRGFVRQTDFFNKNIASEITDNYFLVEKGEFCYNKSYSNGYPWGATKRLNDFEKAVVTTLYICFGVKDEKKTNAEFFEQFFGANNLDKGLTKIAHEGGRAHGLLNVTPSDFFSLKVTIPPYEEQTAITAVLRSANREIELLKAKAENLREQKRGLMQQLLTGKKRLKH